jgi:hypothetical protein
LHYVAAAAAEFDHEERRQIFGANAAKVYNIATKDLELEVSRGWERRRTDGKLSPLAGE